MRGAGWGGGGGGVGVAVQSANPRSMQFVQAMGRR